MIDRNQHWSTDDRERRVRRRAEWGTWTTTRPRKTWNGVDRHTGTNTTDHATQTQHPPSH